MLLPESCKKISACNVWWPNWQAGVLFFFSLCPVSSLPGWPPLPPSLPSPLASFLCLLPLLLYPSLNQDAKSQRKKANLQGYRVSGDIRVQTQGSWYLFLWSLEYYLPRKQGHSQEDNALNFPGDVNWLALKNLDLMDKQLEFNQRLKSISLSLTFLTFLVFSLSLRTSHMAFYLMINSHALTCVYRA